ncbi:HAD-IA family hydrolase [Pseudomonas eucalypticola]|uniref:HAD-IA family hydrolase n=1 Tax=Pseudomonas eucalypticola TaxID=2599595 RepID=A0A7D5H617_9PSED|nr:HAD-IA family hydrolase [Pseudomonas eucalypticola]
MARQRRQAARWLRFFPRKRLSPGPGRSGGRAAPIGRAIEPPELAAKWLGLPPSDCLAVEDAPAGLRAAHAAGCQVLAVATTLAPAALSGERWSNDLHGLEVLG